MVKAGYKLTEVGEIPEDWVVKNIASVALITTGSKNTQDKIDDGIYPFIVRSQTVERINTYSFDGEAVLTAGDGVGTGKIFHYVNGKFDYHQRVYNIYSFKSELNGFYFYKYFSSQFYDRIMSMTAKSSVDSVRREMIADMHIALPKLEEQESIAEVLSNVDMLIESLEKLIAKKCDIKTATMQQLLTGKKRLPGFGKGKGYKLTEVGEIPEDWEIKTYGDIFDFLTTASNSRDELSENENIKYIHYGDIHTRWNFKLDFTVCSLPTISRIKFKGAVFVKDGDLVMADASEDYEGIGKSIEVRGLGDSKAIAGLHTFLLRDKNKVFISGYRGYLHAIAGVKKHFDRLATGMKVYGLSKSNLKTVPLPVPLKKSEQHAIAEVLSNMDNEISALESRLKKTKAIKQGMMQELLTGKTRLKLSKPKRESKSSQQRKPNKMKIAQPV